MNKKRIWYLTIIVLVGIVSALAICKAKKNMTSMVSNTTLSNKKVCWGIKRNDNHEQPDLGSKNKQLLDEYNGIAMGNNNKNIIYLTFDEGYEAGYTGKILDILKENNVQATFFITGHYLNTEPELVKRMIDEGHIVGNHTVNHYSMPEISDEDIKSEIMDLHTSVFEKFGYEMKYIRPPKGELSERTLSICNSLGYTNVLWSFAYDDWDTEKQGKQDYAKEKILNNLHNGEVMLLHATSSDNCEILDEMIKTIKNQGYEFKSLDEFDNADV